MILPTTRSRASALGGLRVLIGAGLFARPELAARLAGLDRGTARRSAFLTRMVAVREVAVGAGLAAAGARGASVRPWLLAAAACDAGDTVAVALAWRRGSVGTAPCLAALAAGAGGAVAHAALAAQG